MPEKQKITCPAGKKPFKITRKAGETAGEESWACRWEPFSSKLMRVRLIDPDPYLWYDLVKFENYYYVAPRNVKKVRFNVIDANLVFESNGNHVENTLRFFVFDIGQFNIKGCVGICFLKGLPASRKKYGVGERVDYKDFISQNIMAEYSAIGVSKETVEEYKMLWRSTFEKPGDKKTIGRIREIQQEAIEKFNQKYSRVATTFLERETGSKIKSLDVVPKDLSDFQAIIRYV